MFLSGSTHGGNRMKSSRRKHSAGLEDFDGWYIHRTEKKERKKERRKEGSVRRGSRALSRSLESLLYTNMPEG